MTGLSAGRRCAGEGVGEADKSFTEARLAGGLAVQAEPELPLLVGPFLSHYPLVSLAG